MIAHAQTSRIESARYAGFARVSTADDAPRAKLLARIRRRYELSARELTFGRWKIQFTQIRDPDVVLDQIVNEADRREKLYGEKQSDEDLHLPYWAELWDSAFGIAEFLVDPQPAIRRPQSILDLGCGMGLVGTVATALGHRVMLADIEADALLLARYNAMQFGEPGARRIDWRRDRLDERFDLIAGADVLYDKSQWDFLDAFWRAHLAVEGSVLLGEPGRQTGEMFLEWIAGRGWRVDRSEQTIATRENPIRLFRLFR